MRRFPGALWLFAALLVAADLVFITLHVLEMLDVLPPYRAYDTAMLITFEGSYGEMFQHAEEAAIAVCLAVAAVRHRQILFGAWALVFAYLLVDDRFQIHEGNAVRLTELLRLPPMLRTQDVGEVAVSLAAAAILLTPVALAWWRADPPARRAGLHLAALLGLIAFFGIVVDLAHALIGGSELVLGTLEDGGEMVAMSLVLVYALHLLRLRPQPATASPAVVVQ